MKSVKEALSYGTNELEMSSTPSARLDGEVLLAFVLGISREKLLINPQYPISDIQYLKFKKLIAKRTKNYPIAYLTGSKEFYGIDFFVNENVLVPRPETETLVEEVIGFVNSNTDLLATSPKIIEIGTGSGCISLTLVKYLPNAKIIAADISDKALSVARKNKKNLGLSKVQFKKSDLLSNTKSKPDVIIANLPYLTLDELREPSIAKEPRLALYGGKDGIEIYEKLFKQIKKKLIDNHSHLTIFLEIGEKQAKKIRDLSRYHFPNSTVEVKKDLSKKDRIVLIRI